ncbi:MAG: LacI family DNA-binding transcriptional regulator [Anaerolineales bacterium]|nr:LacI family DNA-binding transcriptional regulator [Anaerolineales bacterium]
MLLKRRTTLKDVAARAGVTYQTVSKVINGRAQVLPETEARIWEATRALGYKPSHTARSLRVQRSLMIGYSWVPTRPDQANHILDMFLGSMIEEAEAVGYHLLPFPYREGDAQVNGYRELIDSGRVDGFVLSSVNYDDPRIRFLQERQYPFVAFGRSNPAIYFPYVDVDGAAGLRLATEHLLSLGHRRIAVLAWPAGSQVGDNRLSGFLAALAAAGVPKRPEWMVRAEGTFEAGRAAAARWLAGDPSERPTGIVALNDTLALGASRAAQERGLLPGRDLAIVGFDDAPMAQYVWPPLSSVRQPIRLAGRKCVEVLVALLEGRTPAATQVLLTPELVVRASSGQQQI